MHKKLKIFDNRRIVPKQGVRSKSPVNSNERTKKVSRKKTKILVRDQPDGLKTKKIQLNTDI